MCSQGPELLLQFKAVEEQVPCLRQVSREVAWTSGGALAPHLEKENHFVIDSVGHVKVHMWNWRWKGVAVFYMSSPW